MQKELKRNGERRRFVSLKDGRMCVVAESGANKRKRMVE